jgi:hypothetical protein
VFIALYRWKIKTGCEAVFHEGWRRLTLEIREKRNGWGSRLHKAEDGSFIAYAQWKDRETREAAFKIPASDTEAAEMMNSSIEEQFPAVYMSVVDDLLLHKFEE